MDDKKVINIIKKYLKALSDNGIKVDKAILFGSYAKGEARANSDIDLLLVSSMFNEENDDYTGIIWRLTEVSEYKIEPIAIGEKRYLEDDVSPLLEIARTEGVKISI